jgi:hypothetical protein
MPSLRSNARRQAEIDSLQQEIATMGELDVRLSRNIEARMTKVP